MAESSKQRITSSGWRVTPPRTPRHVLWRSCSSCSARASHSTVVQARKKAEMLSSKKTKKDRAVGRARTASFPHLSPHGCYTCVPQDLPTSKLQQRPAVAGPLSAFQPLSVSRRATLAPLHARYMFRTAKFATAQCDVQQSSTTSE